jgi:hypothetical protein
MAAKKWQSLELTLSPASNKRAFCDDKRLKKCRSNAGMDKQKNDF